MSNNKQLGKDQIIGYISALRAVIILILICIVASILSSSFLNVSNIFNVIRQVSIVSIIACGMNFVILTGGIDLSVGSIVGFSGAVSAGFLFATGNTFLTILIGVGLGALCGIGNGFFVAKLGIPPFIATLGMMTLLRGCTLLYTKGAPIPAKEDAFKWIGKGSLFNVPFPIILLVIFFIIAFFILGNTKFGRSVYALGGNREATRLSGINVIKTEWMTYIICGLLSGVSAIVLISRLGSAQATAGEGYELDAIAAVILGGTSLSGGSGNVLPTVAGALIMGLIDNILTLLNVDPHATNIVKGGVILVAVWFDKKVKDLSSKADIA